MDDDMKYLHVKLPIQKIQSPGLNSGLEICSLATLKNKSGRAIELFNTMGNMHKNNSE